MTRLAMEKSLFLLDFLQAQDRPHSIHLLRRVGAPMNISCTQALAERS